jgi:hypothetical protein
MDIRGTGLVVILALGVVSACGYGSGGGGLGGGTVTVSMNAINGSGVSGTARIDDQGNASTVTVELQHVPSGAHAGHVHLGSCAQQGVIVFGLNPITPDAAGNGSAITNGVSDVFIGPGYSIEYHVALDPPGDPIACADIP